MQSRDTFSPTACEQKYLLVLIKIRSHILFKITALKSVVKSEFVLLSNKRAKAAQIVTTDSEDVDHTVFQTNCKRAASGLNVALLI